MKMSNYKQIRTQLLQFRAEQNGRRVRARYTLPIKFELE